MGIISDLKQEHQRTRVLLQAFRAHFSKSHLRHPQGRQSLAYAAEFFIDTPDDLHHCKERILYRHLLRCISFCHQPLDDLYIDHQKLRQQRAQLIEILNDIVCKEKPVTSQQVAFVNQYIAAVTAQIDKEEQQLFPMCHSHFRKEDWQAVNEAIDDLTVAYQLAQKCSAGNVSANAEMAC